MFFLISIHPPREGWDVFIVFLLLFSDVISIHPPREGWDGGKANRTHIGIISIHPPREGWDP